MFVNLTLSERLWPGIVSLQQSAGRGKGVAILAFIIACPIPVGVCFIWYKIFNWIDGKLKKLSSGDEETVNLASTVTAIGNPSPDAAKEEKLGSSLAAYAGLYGLTIFIGMIMACYGYSFLEKIGKPRPQKEFFTLMIAIPVLASIIYVYKRSTLIKRSSNQKDAPDRKDVR